MVDIAAGEAQELMGESDGELTEPLVRAAIARANGGVDIWGRPLKWTIAEADGSRHLIILSLGSDGKLDLPQIEDYLRAPVEDIRGHVGRDIVYVDGQARTVAWKD